MDHLRKREVSALEEEEERCPNEEGNNVEKPAEEPQNATLADQQTQGERSQHSSSERNDRMVTTPIAPRISTRIRFPPVRFRDEYGIYMKLLKRRECNVLTIYKQCAHA